MKIFIGAVIAGLLVPVLYISANGGNQKVVAEKYVVQLSMAPLSPRALETTSMIVSLADIAKTPLAEKVILRVFIRPQGSDRVLYDSGENELASPNYEFSYRFPRAGLYEVFTEFRLARAPEGVYRPEDFLISVEPRPAPVVPAIVAAFLAGFVVGFLMRFKKHAV